MNQKIDVAAYIWPAYTGKEPRTKMFWPEGIGEWETVREAKPKFEGHLWPRKPLWGYTDEADPTVMEMQINEALRHGVNVFIYDWYWFDERPFLEQCLNEGFLKARNNRDMKFYLMWANHDANYSWDRRISSCEERRTVIWKGTTNTDNFKIIGRRWLEKYFTLPNYYKIDNKPLISIYDLRNFIDTFGSIEKTAEMMTWLDDEAKNYGLDGIIEVRRADGLDGIEQFAPDDIMILGMGGELIARIISDAPWTKNKSINLCLQPMTHPEYLREFLLENGYEIIDEAIAEEEKIYQIILARFSGEKQSHAPEELLLGRINIARGGDALVRLGEHWISVIERRADGKRTSGADVSEDTELIQRIKIAIGR